MKDSENQAAYRPGCVTAYAVLLIVAGGLYASVALGNSGEPGILLFVFWGLAALLITMGVGLWQMKKWGWWLTIIMQALAILGSLASGIISFIVSAIVNGGILYWFVQNQSLFEGDGLAAAYQTEQSTKSSSIIAMIVGAIAAFFLLAVVTIAILTLLGPQIGNVFSQIVDGLESATPSP